MTLTELNIGFIEFYPNNETSRMHPYTLASRSKQPPKFPKSMAAPALTEKKIKKHGHTTIAIRNAGYCAKLKVNEH